MELSSADRGKGWLTTLVLTPLAATSRLQTGSEPRWSTTFASEPYHSARSPSRALLPLQSDSTTGLWLPDESPQALAQPTLQAKPDPSLSRHDAVSQTL